MTIATTPLKVRKQKKVRRFVIVFDGHRWHVRALRVSEHDLERDEMVYRCDEPIATCNSLADAAAVVGSLTARPGKAGGR